MMEIRRILCPIDFSVSAQRALEQAVPLAREYGARLIGLYVTPTAPHQGSVMGSLAAGVQKSAWDQIPWEKTYADLGEWLAPARALGLATETHVADGPTARVILQQARQLRADLVVMGTHGRSGFERLVLGSVTEKVLRSAPCPVLVVPHAVERALNGDGPPFTSLVCGVDFSEASLVALRYACSLAQRSRARVTAAYVMDPVLDEETRLRTRYDVVEFRRFVHENALRRLREAFPAEAGPDAPDAVVLSGEPYDALVSLAGARGADLIVLGVHGRGALELRLFGSTSHHVIRAAPCPVLTVGREVEDGAGFGKTQVAS
jgi:nucleotide-binding universal stress UspA family protein